MKDKHTDCEDDSRTLKIWYLVICAGISLFTILAVSTSHWVQMVEGRRVADIVANMEENAENSYPAYDDCSDKKICPPLEDVPEEDTSEVMPPKVLYIYSSLGLWRICYRTEILPTRCVGIDYVRQSWGSVRGQEGEITIYIARGVRRSSFTALLAVITLISGSLIALISVFSTKPALAVSAMILKMASAMFLLLTIIIFLAGIQNEASMAPQAEEEDDDQPSFHYVYGWSFHLLVVSYLGSNVAAVLGITLYIQRFRKHENIVNELESSTEGELIYTNDNLPEWPIRTEISV